MRTLSCVAILLLCSGTIVLADRLLLRNGQEMNGRLISVQGTLSSSRNVVGSVAGGHATSIVTTFEASSSTNRGLAIGRGRPGCASASSTSRRMSDGLTP